MHQGYEKTVNFKFALCDQLIVSLFRPEMELFQQFYQRKKQTTGIGQVD